jgi:hypothetical protein
VTGVDDCFAYPVCSKVESVVVNQASNSNRFRCALGSAPFVHCPL